MHFFHYQDIDTYRTISGGMEMTTIQPKFMLSQQTWYPKKWTKERAVPLFLHRPESGWFYEGSYVTQELFSIPDEIWNHPDMSDIKEGVVTRLCHQIPPILSEIALTSAIIRAAREQYRDANDQVVCVGLKCVKWDSLLYQALRQAHSKDA